MSRGLGYNNRLLLAAMLDLNEHAGDDGWREVYGVARHASVMAAGRPFERYAADVRQWTVWMARRAHKVPQGRPQFGAYLNVGRVLRILERRGLVERHINGPGSMARLTAAGKVEAARWLTGSRP